MILYPLNLNITDQLCVVIGGGGVAARKIAALLPCKARIRVISPALSQQTQRLLKHRGLEWIQRPYRPGDLDGARLAFALTDQPEVQHQVAAEARDRGIPVNIADNPEACTFQTPATVRQGELLISISTGGGSPALAATIRKELEQHYGQEYADLLQLITAVRQHTMSLGLSPEKHAVLVGHLLQENILALLKDKAWRQLQEVLLAILPQEVNAALLVQNLQNC